MEQVLKNVSVQRAIAALGIEVGQIASSIVFRLPNGKPLLVITSGRHRVDTDLVVRPVWFLQQELRCLAFGESAKVVS